MKYIFMQCITHVCVCIFCSPTTLTLLFVVLMYTVINVITITTIKQNATVNLLIYHAEGKCNLPITVRATAIPILIAKIIRTIDN